MIYGQADDNAIITRYLPGTHLENGIKQSNLDFILDLLDKYIEVVEAINIS